MAHLKAEGRTDGVYCVGDVMADALVPLAARARERSKVLARLSLAPRGFVVATLHRADNTDDRARLSEIVAALNAIEETVVLPVHPRTRKALDSMGAMFAPNVIATDPVGYLDMLQLVQHAKVILNLAVTSHQNTNGIGKVGGFRGSNFYQHLLTIQGNCLEGKKLA